MLFNSLDFLLFLAVFTTLYIVSSRSSNTRKILLVTASYLFYMAANPPFALLLFGSTLLDFVAAKRIVGVQSAKARRRWLAASCIGNIGVLVFFKYSDFLLSSVWGFIPAVGVYPEFITNVALPVGISFYTFQSMSYTIDVYRDHRYLENSFLNFAVYVSFFPQLVAGPILRSRDYLPQLKNHHGSSGEDILLGIDQIIRGFAKKVIIADALAVYVGQIYGAPAEYGSWNILLATYAFTFQLYFDFSGYSDIAIGLARVMGFRIPENFRLPYLARGPADFWKRWHISLSSWFRDYFYIPIGGSRTTKLKIFRNLFLTVLISGLWHGAAWPFVLWGAYHGLWLVSHRYLFRDHQIMKVPAFVSIVSTFHFWCVSLVIFRAESVSDLVRLYGGFFDFSTPFVPVDPFVIGLILFGPLSHLLGASTRLKDLWQRTHFSAKAVYYALIIVAVFFRSSDTVEFVYFQF